MTDHWYWSAIVIHCWINGSLFFAFKEQHIKPDAFCFTKFVTNFGIFFLWELWRSPRYTQKLVREKQDHRLGYAIDGHLCLSWQFLFCVKTRDTQKQTHLVLPTFASQLRRIPSHRQNCNQFKINSHVIWMSKAFFSRFLHKHYFQFFHKVLVFMG